MDLFHQIVAVCGWNFRGLATRTQSSLIVVLGFFGVVLVFVAVLAMRDGVAGAMTTKGADGVGLIYSDFYGSVTEAMIPVISQAPGVAQSPHGPLVSGTLYAFLQVPKWAPGLVAEAAIRGVDDKFISVMPGFHIVKGRMFRTGLNELIVGVNDARLFPQLDVGKSVHWRARDWTVVGEFATGSARYDSSAFTDLRQVQALDTAGARISSIFVKLVSPTAFDAFKTYLERDPRFRGTIDRLSNFQNKIGQQLSTLLETADGVITLLMAVGAVFGALNIMYANVANRRAEMATLRALGFRRVAILVAVLSEALGLALLGGGLGVLGAWLLFNGYEASTALGGTLTEFRFNVTSLAIGIGLLLTLIMGFLGGLFPAIRAARLPVARALREA
ncbi:MAG TPA: FtsX-like permease family protein [Rhizomicrobium sp.]|nr:FtsX-like permease family protein [Rhizomicrobium sp.]